MVTRPPDPQPAEDSRPSWQRVARFMGYADAAGFANAFLRHWTRCAADVPHRVRAGARAARQPAVRPGAAISAGDGRAGRHDRRAAGAWATSEPAHDRRPRCAAGWPATCAPCDRSARATLMTHHGADDPDGAQPARPHPDEAFRRFDRFIAALPAGRAADVAVPAQPDPAGAGRHRAGRRRRRWRSIWRATPARWKGCSRPMTGIRSAAACWKPGLARRRDLQESIQIIRRAVTEEDFQLSVGHAGGAPGRRCRRARSAQPWPMRRSRSLMPRVLDDFSRALRPREGRRRWRWWCMGKAGGQEMMAGSDLDLMLIYDHPRRRDREPRRARACRPASGSSGPRRPASPR